MGYRNTILPWFLAMFLVVVAGLAGAQGQSQSDEATVTSPLQGCLKRFEAMDKKHRGKITKEEFIASGHGGARAEKIFASKDSNHDGNMTKEEFCAGAGAGADKTVTDPAALCKTRFNAMDANHDGVVTKDEFMAGRKPGGKAEEVFKQKDANGNGSLSLEEFCGVKGSEQPKKQ
jgi:Ca2+-binding EF-hand superfamily protein